MWCQQKQYARDRGTENKVILMCCLALLAPQKSVLCEIKRRYFEVSTKTIQFFLNLKILSLKSFWQYLFIRTLLLAHWWQPLGGPPPSTKHVFMEHGWSRRQESQIWQISKSQILTRPTQGAWDVSEMWAMLRWTYCPSLVTVWPT